MANHRAWICSFLLLSPHPLLAGAKRYIEKHSSREDLAGDVPQDREGARFSVRDQIYGVRVSNKGAPVVQFYEDEALIVGFVQAGVSVELNSLRVHKGINYWPVSYTDDKGQSQLGWISGLFVSRE